jgi:hypothetical protein
MIVNRRTLRQRLGQLYLRDTLVGSTTGSWGATASLTVWASNLADLTLSGEGLYGRSIVRTLTASGYIQDARVASFNTGSGAFHCLVLCGTTIASGIPYEIHKVLPPDEADLILTDVAGKLRQRQVVTLDTVADLTVYSIASEVLDVGSVKFYGYPTASSNGVDLLWYKIAPANDGQELRIPSAFPVSGHLAIDAVTPCSLGAADTATINLPDDRWLLSGAAAQAYWALEAGAPAQEVQAYQARRREMGATFSRLSARFQPRLTRKVMLENWE